MIGSEGSINAFQSASGVSAIHLSLFIRTVLSALFLMWSSWNVYGQMQLVQDQALDIHDLTLCVLRILFLCALMVVVVFIS